MLSVASSFRLMSITENAQAKCPRGLEEVPSLASGSGGGGGAHSGSAAPSLQDFQKLMEGMFSRQSAEMGASVSTAVTTALEPLDARLKAVEQHQVASDTRFAAIEAKLEKAFEDNAKSSAELQRSLSESQLQLQATAARANSSPSSSSANFELL